MVFPPGKAQPLLERGLVVRILSCGALRGVCRSLMAAWAYVYTS